LTRVNVATIVAIESGSIPGLQNERHYMASLRRKDRSPFWFACYTLPDGRRTQHSTGTTNKRKAQRIAAELDAAARDASEGRFIESRARKAIAHIFSIANADKLPSSNTEDFFEAWLARKSLEAGEGTHEKYSNVVAQFKATLGSKVKRDISAVSAADITHFRDALAKRVAPGTVNVALKIIRSAFGQARRDGLVDVNEAERVTTLKKRKDAFERRPFTLEELRRILEVANDEWKGLILFGLYTGQRLGDIAALTWNNLDLERQELRFTTGKTKRRQILPLAAPVLRYVESLPAGDQPDAPIFPRAAAIVQERGRASQLSKVLLTMPRLSGSCPGGLGGHCRTGCNRFA
jgi:integrase